MTPLYQSPPKYVILVIIRHHGFVIYLWWEMQYCVCKWSGAGAKRPQSICRHKVDTYIQYIHRTINLHIWAKTKLLPFHRRHFEMHVLENVWISLKISLKFDPKVRMNNIPILVLIMAWHHPGDKPSSEPMMVLLLTHICINRPQWVKRLKPTYHNQHNII